MPLSIFIDALPYSEVVENYRDWYKSAQVSLLVPNIAYSSSLHWQLYCNKYPDDRGVFLDWGKSNETNKKIKFISNLLKPLDRLEYTGLFSKKILDRLIFRKNTFANIPYRFRPYFSCKGEYLFWNEQTYLKEEIFRGYNVISQDEGHISFDDALNKLTFVIQNTSNPKIFFNTGFPDSIGHKIPRGKDYSATIAPYMVRLRQVIEKYLDKYPNQEVLIVSDHGMSTICNTIDLDLERHFGAQSSNTYIAYCDSCIMCIWTSTLKKEIAEFLQTRSEGHLLTEEEREYYRVTDPSFGSLIFILKEGNVFSNSWFGKSLKTSQETLGGMHGFWPLDSSLDQMATIVLINGKRRLDKEYDYIQANRLINQVMQNEVF